MLSPHLRLSVLKRGLSSSCAAAVAITVKREIAIGLNRRILAHNKVATASFKNILPFGILSSHSHAFAIDCSS